MLDTDTDLAFTELVAELRDDALARAAFYRGLGWDKSARTARRQAARYHAALWALSPFTRR